MPFIDTAKLDTLNKRPGWRGKLFDSANNTFVHWEFDAGADIHAHHRIQEEVWHILEGELDVTISGETRSVGPEMVALIPPDTPHSVLAETNGRGIVVDHPLRKGF